MGNKFAKHLCCQECRGSGEIFHDKIDHYEINLPCGFCNGTGYVIPQVRGLWLRFKKEEKYESRPVKGCIQQCEDKR